MRPEAELRLSGSMQVEVRGALRFQHRAGLEKGVLAFDDHAYPEFFKSSLWSLAGAFATCERTFEIEPDCDYTKAFRAMANLAVEGTIELREQPKAKEFTRFIRIPKLRQWMATPVNTKYAAFGSEVEKFATTWAEKLVAAKTAEVVKDAKEAKRASAIDSLVVELPANASQGVVLADGTLALACVDTIVFVKHGEIVGQSKCTDENWGSFGFSNLVSLGDRVLAFQELARGAWLAKPGDTTMTELPFDDLCIKGASPTGVVWSYNEVFTLDGVKLVPWPEDSIYAAAMWRDGIVACSRDKLAFFDRDGNKRWEIAGGDKLVVRADDILARQDSAMIQVDAAGVVLRTAESCRLTFGSAYETSQAWELDGDMVLFALDKPFAGTWNLATGEVIKVKTHDAQMLMGCTRVGDLTACWASPPMIGTRGTRDTSVALVRGSEVVARFDAKADVIAGCAVGEALAVRLDGTKASKILVWKAGKVTTLAHKGEVRGLAAVEGRLASWGADQTLRIWTV